MRGGDEPFCHLRSEFPTTASSGRWSECQKNESDKRATPGSELYRLDRTERPLQNCELQSPLFWQ